jgi:hypothetical protein
MHVKRALVTSVCLSLVWIRLEFCCLMGHKLLSLGSEGLSGDYFSYQPLWYIPDLADSEVCLKVGWITTWGRLPSYALSSLCCLATSLRHATTLHDATSPVSMILPTKHTVTYTC